jgi:hypothetical protein
MDKQLQNLLPTTFFPGSKRYLLFQKLPRGDEKVRGAAFNAKRHRMSPWSIIGRLCKGKNVARKNYS